MSIRVIYGANDGNFEFKKLTVGSLRRALREVFNVLESAFGLIEGEPIADDQIVNDGETVEFINPDGHKGLGRLLKPEEIQSEWQLNSDQYEELLVLGLPVLRFADGIDRHPEAAVDEFMRQLGDTNRQQPPEIVGTDYISSRLGCTSVWVTEMIRTNQIPPNCVVAGTGNGKPWKLVRVRIDEWLKRR